jgi:IQ calmodulin-binding motif
MFGKIRPPMKWSRPRVTTGAASLRMSRRSIGFSSEQDLVRKALLFPATATHTVVKTVTKMSASKVENAIKALSAAFTNPRRVKTIEDYGQTQIGSDEGSVTSDLTLPSAFEFSPEDVSGAEEIVLNARRKQAILIGIMIKLQAHCRTKLAQSYSNRIIEESRYLNVSSSKNLYWSRRRRKAAILIQSCIRAMICQQTFLRVRRSIIRLQTLRRSQRLQLGYILLIGILSRFQAVIRGRSVRRRLLRLIEMRMDFYRSLIFEMWKESHTPLSYRTKYWPAIQFSSFLCHAFAERELTRLWNSFHITSARESGVSSSIMVDTTKSTTSDDRLGVADTCYRKALKVCVFARSSQEILLKLVS